jgi:hypothetical protein
MEASYKAQKERWFRCYQIEVTEWSFAYKKSSQILLQGRFTLAKVGM